MLYRGPGQYKHCGPTAIMRGTEQAIKAPCIKNLFFPDLAGISLL